jgi:hypothetical protein
MSIRKWMSEFPSRDDLGDAHPWTPCAVLLMLIAFCFGTIFACYASVLKLSQQSGLSPGVSQAAAIAACLLVAFPGGVLWRMLRPRSKRAALYGLLLSSVLSVCVAAIIGNL